jgi:GrpB-like predicted nucleotidyltransferase (UPF0157 family)
MKKNMNLGLQRGTVELVPYRSAWKNLFTEEKDRLEEVIGRGYSAYREHLNFGNAGKTNSRYRYSYS